MRVALVGAGYWGSKLLSSLRALGEDSVTVRWVCERDLARAEHVRELAPTARFTEILDPVLADPDTDALLVAIPPDQHPETAIRCLEAGKHLFLEKPMAITLPDAERIARTAECFGQTFMVGFTYRYNFMVEEAKRRIETGSLGRVHACFSQRSALATPRAPRDLLWSLAPHDISVLQYLFGETPGRIEAHGWNSGAHSTIDSAWLGMDFGSVETRVFLSWAHPPKSRRLMAFGSEGTFVMDETETDPSRRVSLYAPVPEGPNFPWTTGAGFTVPEPPPGTPFESIAVTGEAPLLSECRHFVSCAREGLAVRTGAQVGLAVTRLICALEAALNANEAPLPASLG